MNNLGKIHTNCAEARLRKFQQENPHLRLVPGEDIKIKFTQGDTSEWMWVHVTKRDDKARVCSGYLNSDPARLTNIKYKDEVNDISYDKICETYF